MTWQGKAMRKEVTGYISGDTRAPLTCLTHSSSLCVLAGVLKPRRNEGRLPGLAAFANKGRLTVGAAAGGNSVSGNAKMLCQNTRRTMLYCFVAILEWRNLSCSHPQWICEGNTSSNRSTFSCHHTATILCLLLARVHRYHERFSLWPLTSVERKQEEKTTEI